MILQYSGDFSGSSPPATTVAPGSWSRENPMESHRSVPVTSSGIFIALRYESRWKYHGSSRGGRYQKCPVRSHGSREYHESRTPSLSRTHTYSLAQTNIKSAYDACLVRNCAQILQLRYRLYSSLLACFRGGGADRARLLIPVTLFYTHW